ncbi:MAG: general secretion pathway protein GspB [Kangiellaceae bacterium]
MSILLDSLKQPKNKEAINVPSVHDSHFDDDMLNDDKLIKSKRFWKIMSFLLLLALIVSWTYVFFAFSKTTPLETSISKSEKVERDKVETFQQENSENNNEAIENNQNKIVEEKSIQVERNKQYAPQKRESVKSAVTSQQIVFSTPKQEKENENNVPPKTAAKANDAVYYEELPTEILMELPSLDISSYAVSSNTKKSFIVLNGSFFGIGDVVAANLQLLSIDKQDALFQYKNTLFRKKYK